MATKTFGSLTLADWAKRQDPNGNTAKIVELLSQTNEILEDAQFMEGNLATGHQATQRTGLPSVAYRKMNQGVPPSKSKTAQITESTAMLEGIMEVDKAEAELGGNVASFLESESVAFTESMNQQMAQTTFYGSSTSPEEFVGLAERYNDKSAKNGQNIIDAGGTGSDNCSIWLIGWGANEISMIFPKGSQAGLEMNDLGVDWATDSNGNKYRAYQSQWIWKNGLCVKDWRFGVRIANVDVSDLRNQSGTQAESASTAIIKLMTRATARLPRLSGVTLSFYAPRVVCEMLRVAAQDKSSNVLNVEQSTNQFGQDIFTLRFMGVPVRIVDQLLETEAQVVQGE
jgi:hypothetical protein